MYDEHEHLCNKLKIADYNIISIYVHEKYFQLPKSN